MANPGDRVEIKTKEKTQVGILMPEHDNAIVLKLDSGYNIGIDKKNVVSSKVIEARKEKMNSTSKEEHKDKSQSTQNQSLPKISILHTGGTIASKVDYETGGVIPRFSPDELMKMFPELANIANISSRLIGNILSEEMRFIHFNILAKEIEKEINAGAHGIIITHGTDYLHYSGAALSFALENLNIPIILVGAQRSSDRPSSDAAFNAISAAYFIANSKWHGVGICMHENESDDWCNILPGLKSRKMHTSRRDAFKPINASPIARVNIKQKQIEINEKQKPVEGKFALRLFNENLKIGILKSHPQLFPEEIAFYKDFDGMIFEVSGLGHFPISKMDDHTQISEKIFVEIKKLAAKIPVAVAPQTIYGRVNMDVYSNGRKMLSAGVLGNMCDMTPETAFIKLAWLLSNYKGNEIKELYGKNLRGEISDRTENKFDVF